MLLSNQQVVGALTVDELMELQQALAADSETQAWHHDGGAAAAAVTPKSPGHAAGSAASERPEPQAAPKALRPGPPPLSVPLRPQAQSDSASAAILRRRSSGK